MKYMKVWQIMDGTFSRGRAKSAKELLETYIENILLFAGHSNIEVKVTPEMFLIEFRGLSSRFEIQVTKEEIEHLEIFNKDADDELLKLILNKANLL